MASGILIVTGLPSSAAARARTVAPAGNSAVSQYIESIPSAKGSRPVPTLHVAAHGPTGSGTAALAPSVQRALADQGSSGRQVAALAAATGSHGAPRHRPGARPLTATGASAVDGSSPVSAVLKAVTGSTGSGGLGALLPAILLGMLVAPALLVRRRRRRSP